MINRSINLESTWNQLRDLKHSIFLPIFLSTAGFGGFQPLPRYPLASGAHVADGQLVWCCGAPSLCFEPWFRGSHLGCRYKRYVAGAPKHPDGVICCCHEFCSPNIYEDLGNWPTKTHSSWDASGLMFIQAPSPVDCGQVNGMFDVSWSCYLLPRMVFSFAGISCLQAMSYATLPFAEEKNTFLLFVFFWRMMWTFIGKLFFFQVSCKIFSSLKF